MSQELSDDSVTYRSDGRKITDGTTVLQNSSSFQRTWQNGKTGYLLPNYRQIIADGRNATTAFSGFETKRMPVELTATCTLKGPKNNLAFYTDNLFQTYTDDQGLAAPTDPSVVGGTDVDIVAREQFLSKYRSARTAFQGGMFLGELMETVRMIKSPAQALRREVAKQRDAAKKQYRRFRNPKHAVKAVADSWLEFAYGARPFVRDVQSAVSLADASPTRWREEIKGYSSMTFRQEPLRIQRTCPQFTYPYYEMFVKREVEESMRYMGAVDANRSPQPSYAEQMGLSWSNVLPTAWELIPYSFLIDYFTNIGKVISGISEGQVGLAWGCRTWRKSCTSTVIGAGAMNDFMKDSFGPNYDFFATVNGSGKAGHNKVFTREGISEIGISSADIRFKLPNSGTQWLNLAALAVSKVADAKWIKSFH
jgi:hypothetical protein